MFDELVIFDTPVLHRDGNHWSHLVARDIDLLHEFAQKIGLKKVWFQDKPGLPHYDIKTDRVRSLAKHHGAVQVQRKYLYIYLQVRHKLQTLHGTDPMIIGFIGIPDCGYLKGFLENNTVCDKCYSPLFFNRQWDNWCSNPACEYNMAHFKPYFDKVNTFLLPRNRSCQEEAENKPGND